MLVFECISLGVFMCVDSIGIRLIVISYEVSSDIEMVIVICVMKMLMLLVLLNRFGMNMM